MPTFCVWILYTVVYSWFDVAKLHRRTSHTLKRDGSQLAAGY